MFTSLPLPPHTLAQDSIASHSQHGSGQQSGAASAAAAVPASDTKLEEQVDRIVSPLRMALVLDNTEDPLNGAAAQFRDWLQHMLDLCPGLTILCNSRQSIGGGFAGVSEKVYTLTRLR